MLARSHLRAEAQVTRMEANRRVVVCIPAYDEEKTNAKVVVGAKKLADPVIVCDNGSSDRTVESARSLGVQVVRHDGNLGKGRVRG
jgi:glycosyltransferase involved in cell wall biosynthesis